MKNQIVKTISTLSLCLALSAPPRKKMVVVKATTSVGLLVGLSLGAFSTSAFAGGSCSRMCQPTPTVSASASTQDSISLAYSLVRWVAVSLYLP